MNYVDQVQFYTRSFVDQLLQIAIDIESRKNIVANPPFFKKNLQLYLSRFLKHQFNIQANNRKRLMINNYFKLLFFLIISLKVIKKQDLKFESYRNFSGWKR